MAPAPDSSRIAALCGLASSALAFAVPLLGAWARPGYDSVAQYVSELGEHGAADGALVSLGGFLPIGLLGLAFLVLGARALAARAATVLFAAVPLGYLVAAFARCDEGCPAEGSLAQTLHSTFGFFEYLGGISGLVLFGIAFRRAPAWRTLAPVSFAAALLTLVGLAGMLGLGDPSQRGAYQRLSEAALFGWIALASLRLWRGQKA